VGAEQPEQPEQAARNSEDRRAAAAAADRLVARLRQSRERLDASGVGHVQRRLVQADLANQALILAALAFSLLVPVLVTVAALLPLGGADSLPAAVSGRLGLSTRATADLQRLFPTRSAVRGASTFVGTAFTLVSAYAWPTALQRGYEIAWGVSSRGWKGLWRPLVWLTGFVAAGALLMALPTSQALHPPGAPCCCWSSAPRSSSPGAGGPSTSSCVERSAGGCSFRVLWP
jgi:membrane protein